MAVTELVLVCVGVLVDEPVGAALTDAVAVAVAVKELLGVTLTLGGLLRVADVVAVCDVVAAALGELLFEGDDEAVLVGVRVAEDDMLAVGVTDGD